MGHSEIVARYQIAETIHPLKLGMGKRSWVCEVKVEATSTVLPYPKVLN